MHFVRAKRKIEDLLSPWWERDCVACRLTYHVSVKTSHFTPLPHHVSHLTPKTPHTTTTTTTATATTTHTHIYSVARSVFLIWSEFVFTSLSITLCSRVLWLSRICTNDDMFRLWYAFLYYVLYLGHIFKSRPCVRVRGCECISCVHMYSCVCVCLWAYMIPH